MDFRSPPEMAAEGFWLFEGLDDEPYGLLPLINLSGKGGPTSTKHVERIGSYQWYLNDETPTIVVRYFFWLLLLMTSFFMAILKIFQIFSTVNEKEKSLPFFQKIFGQIRLMLETHLQI